MSGNKCLKCAGVFSSDETVAKCTECNDAFHPACTRVGSSEIFTKTKNRSWKCDTCRSEASSVKSTDSVSEDRKFLLEALNAMKSDIITSVNSKIGEVQAAISSLSSEIGLINTKIESLESGHNVLQERCDKLEKAHDTLGEGMKEFVQFQRDMEQHSRCCNIEIQGLPTTTKENIYEVLGRVAGVLQVTYKREDISIAHRLNLFSKKHIYPPIIVQFVSRSVREAWLGAARLKKSFKASELSNSLPPSDVYLNEHLTPFNKALLGRARRLLREKKICFAGFFNGKILIKKKEGDAPRRILELSDLDVYDIK